MYFYPKEERVFNSTFFIEDESLFVYSYKNVVYSNDYVSGLDFEKIDGLGKYLSGSYVGNLKFWPWDWTIDMIISLENIVPSSKPFIYLEKIFAIRIIDKGGDYYLEVGYNGHWSYKKLLQLYPDNEVKFYLLRLMYSFKNHIYVYFNGSISGFSVRSKDLGRLRRDKRIRLFQNGSPVSLYFLNILPYLSLRSYSNKKSLLSRIFNVNIY